MKREAILERFIVDRELRSTEDMVIFDKIGESAIYEVIKIADGIPLFFEAHMERMRRSATLSGVRIQKEDSEILEEISKLVRKNRCKHINVKLVWSRPENEEHFLIYFIRSEYPGPNVYSQGIHTILYHGERETPNIKTLRGSFREQVRRVREETGAYEALLVDREGYITEGSRSNIFFLKDGIVCTPPAGTVLLGVTRHHVVRICKTFGIRVNERLLHQDELAAIDGAFITGTTVDVLPIASIGDRPIRSTSDLQIQKIIKGYCKEVEFYTEQRKSESCVVIDTPHA